MSTKDKDKGPLSQEDYDKQSAELKEKITKAKASGDEKAQAKAREELTALQDEFIANREPISGKAPYTPAEDDEATVAGKSEKAKTTAR